MSDAKTPCQDNPDQWYTERDGRRYDDEPLLSHDEVEAIAADIQGIEGSTLEDVEAAADGATALVVRQRLIERRQAREQCFTDCPMKVRLACLGIALEKREQYGIWGGYYPEQRRAIERELDRRAELAEKHAQDAADAAVTEE